MSIYSRTLVVSDTPDRIDYQRLMHAVAVAVAEDCAVVVEGVCMECPSLTFLPRPGSQKLPPSMSVEHEDWCPVLAHHDGRELTPAQQRRHRRYMDRTTR